MLRNLDGDQDLLVELIAAFQADYPIYVTALREAISQNDASRLEHSAHSLKGEVAVLGATTAYACAAELETMGREARLEGAMPCIDALERELARAVAFLTTPGRRDRQ